MRRPVCKLISNMFCRDFGVLGDCSQGSTASGQCEKASHVFAAVSTRLATVDAKTSVEDSPFAVQETSPLAQCKSSSDTVCCDFGVPGDCSQGSTAAGQWIFSCALVGVFLRELL